MTRTAVRNQNQSEAERPQLIPNGLGQKAEAFRSTGSARVQPPILGPRLSPSLSFPLAHLPLPHLPLPLSLTARIQHHGTGEACAHARVHCVLGCQHDIAPALARGAAPARAPMELRCKAILPPPASL